MRKEIFNFIQKFTNEIKEENAAIFAGAGFSAPVGYVNWSELLEPLADEIGIDISKESDLVSLAQYYKNEKGNRTEISTRIMEEFSKKPSTDENHKIVSRLPITTYWTTNYDTLIEDSLRECGKVADVKYTVNQLAITKPKRDAVVYKMHGDINHPSDTVILKEDYELYSTKYAPFITALSGDLVAKTFLFVGLSFSDPNLDYILSRVRVSYGENQRTHYSFIKKINRSECDSDADYEYFCRKQELFSNDLKRYNIQVLVIDDYSEITEILSSIEQNINKNNIFISGSAYEYSPWGEENAKNFISELSKRLLTTGNKIISGFGLGVGSYVISGALEEIYMHQKSITSEKLVLRPFPQSTVGEMSIKELWHRYRQDMISLAGISIFIFGNKLDDGNKIIEANGMYSEFEIAVQNSNIIVPVGATGYMAKKIWDEINIKFDLFYPNSTEKLRGFFSRLNDNQDYKELINNIVMFINEAKKCFRI